jgi:hypothetical protein
MKKLFIMLFMSSAVFAAEQCETKVGEESVDQLMEITTDVPSHLKGATIIVRTKDGKESQVPAEKFKVVPRKRQYVVTKTKIDSVTTCQNTEMNKNRVSVMAGSGPKEGLKRSNDGTTVSIESKAGTIGGLQYQRLLTDKISVSGQVQTNKSVLLGVGLDF